MTKGDVYRLRIKGIEKRMKHATKTDRSVLNRKKNALSDMADSEDWLDGKSPTQTSKSNGDDAR